MSIPTLFRRPSAMLQDVAKWDRKLSVPTIKRQPSALDIKHLGSRKPNGSASAWPVGTHGRFASEPDILYARRMQTMTPCERSLAPLPPLPPHLQPLPQPVTNLNNTQAPPSVPPDPLVKQLFRKASGKMGDALFALDEVEHIMLDDGDISNDRLARGVQSIADLHRLRSAVVDLQKALQTDACTSALCDVSREKVEGGGSISHLRRKTPWPLVAPNIDDLAEASDSNQSASADDDNEDEGGVSSASPAEENESSVEVGEMTQQSRTQTADNASLGWQDGWDLGPFAPSKVPAKNSCGEVAWHQPMSERMYETRESLARTEQLPKSAESKYDLRVRERIRPAESILQAGNNALRRKPSVHFAAHAVSSDDENDNKSCSQRGRVLPTAPLRLSRNRSVSFGIREPTDVPVDEGTVPSPTSAALLSSSSDQERPSGILRSSRESRSLQSLDVPIVLDGHEVTQRFADAHIAVQARGQKSYSRSHTRAVIAVDGGESQDDAGTALSRRPSLWNSRRRPSTIVAGEICRAPSDASPVAPMSTVDFTPRPPDLLDKSQSEAARTSSTLHCQSRSPIVSQRKMSAARVAEPTNQHVPRRPWQDGSSWVRRPSEETLLRRPSAVYPGPLASATTRVPPTLVSVNREGGSSARRPSRGPIQLIGPQAPEHKATKDEMDYRSAPVEQQLRRPSRPELSLRSRPSLAQIHRAGPERKGVVEEVVC
ncbi:unnamed protein product [Jaminaea pallidilutea]